MAFEENIERRLIAIEADIKLCLSRPIAIDYGSTIANQHQRILLLENKLKAYETVFTSYGEQLKQLTTPKPLTKWFWK